MPTLSLSRFPLILRLHKFTSGISIQRFVTDLATFLSLVTNAKANCFMPTLSLSLSLSRFPLILRLHMGLLLICSYSRRTVFWIKFLGGVHQTHQILQRRKAREMGARKVEGELILHRCNSTVIMVYK